MYSFISRIRYSEVNAQKNLTISGIIDYFQDCSTFHSEDLGVGLEYLERQNKVWVITNWHLKIKRLPHLGEKITISTWPYSFNTLLGYRSFTMTDANGELVAAANSIWVLMDTNTLRPVRTDSIAIEKYVLSEAFPMEDSPRKLDVPHQHIKRESFPVIKSNLDTNYHVNNGQYIKMAMEFLPADFIYQDVLVEYKKSAFLGDTICPLVSLTEGKCTIVLADTDSVPYCILEFRRDPNN